MITPEGILRKQLISELALQYFLMEQAKYENINRNGDNISDRQYEKLYRPLALLNIFYSLDRTMVNKMYEEAKDMAYTNRGLTPGLDNLFILNDDGYWIENTTKRDSPEHRTRMKKLQEESLKNNPPKNVCKCGNH